jgi:acetyltransferase-like isoleucine patch superfamily enzyme
VVGKVKKECLRWKSAILESIPGTIGEFLRNKFYGYRHGLGVRILRGVIIHHPAKLTIGDNSGISSGTQINAAAGITIGKKCVDRAKLHYLESEPSLPVVGDRDQKPRL